MPFIAGAIALFGLVFSIYMTHVVSNLSNIVKSLRYINSDINQNDNSESSVNNLVKLSVLKEANRMKVLSDEEYEVLLTEILDEFDHYYIYDVPFKVK